MYETVHRSFPEITREISAQRLQKPGKTSLQINNLAQWEIFKLSALCVYVVNILYK